MGIKIFITGCARSGTTLLNRLFYSFKDLHIINNEISLKRFIRLSNSFENLVAKRTYNSIFSNIKSEEEILKDLTEIYSRGILIINIYRDGRDVILDGKVTPQRYINSIIQMKKYRRYITYNVEYNRLINEPNIVQNEILNVINSRGFNLIKKYNFSEYPNFVPKEAFNIDKENYKALPLDTHSIGKDLNKYKEICNKNELKEFESLLGEWVC